MSMYPHVYERLLQAREKGRIAHCYLFTGSEGAGKAEAAKNLACALLGISKERLGTHPDFVLLERSGGDDARRDITIDEIREFKKRLLLTSACAGWKVAILERAELLSKEAASALLKILEAPAGNTVITLTAERYGAVLPTIRSRAVRIPFPPPQDSATSSAIGADDAVYELKKLFDEVSEMPYALRFKASERYAKSAGLWEALLRYAAMRFHDELATASSRSLSLVRLITRIKSLIRTDALLMHTNTNPRLLLDVFLLQL